MVPTKTVTQQRVVLTGGKRKTITHQHVAFTGGTPKNSDTTTRYPHRRKTQNKTRSNTLPSPVVRAKQSRNNTLPSPVVRAKQSHNYTLSSPVAHVKKQPRNNTLPSPVVHTKQSRNNTLPSPVKHARNSNATIRCPLRWNTLIITQRYVAFTSGHATTACCPHRRYSQKGAKTTGRFHQRNTITAMQQHAAFTGGRPQ